jgi:hypothetical protein
MQGESEKDMERNEILQKILKKETGRTFAANAIWQEIERAAGEVEEGGHWIVGQDDTLEKWEYYVEISRRYDPDFDQWETDVSLEEIKITNKKTGKTLRVQIKGAELN